MEYIELTRSSITTNPRQDLTKYKFGDESYAGLGKIIVCNPFTDHYSVKVHAEIVDVDVPLPLSLDVLDRLKAVQNFDSYRMSSKSEHWTIPSVI